MICWCEFISGYWWHWLNARCYTSDPNYNSGRIPTHVIAHTQICRVTKKAKLRKPRVLYCCCRIICHPTYKQLREVVAMATDYGLNGPGIECRRGWRFPCPFRPAPRPNQRPVQWMLGFSGLRRPGRGADHPPPSSPMVANALQIAFVSHLCLHRRVMGWPFTYNETWLLPHFLRIFVAFTSCLLLWLT